MTSEVQPAELKARSRKRSTSEIVFKVKQAQLFRMTVAYAVGAWLVIQVTATISPAFEAPPWLLRLVVMLAVAGFIVTIGFAAIVRPPQASDGSPVERRKFWRILLAGVLIAALITAGTFVARRTGLLFGQEKVSLAVLPFTDLSPARDKAYFAEGVAEEILSTLAAERGIKVLGRTSARQIERNPDPRSLRSKLGVTHLLEGSARTSGDQLRMNVRLIDTSDGSQMWEEEYQGRLADVFTVQDQIAATVVTRLRGTFFTEPVREAKATAVDAFQIYLAARALMRDRTLPHLQQAFALAQKVVAADPDYAPGQALLAEVTWMLSDHPNSYGSIPFAEARKRAAEHARVAIRLAPDKGDGYAALGLLLPPEQAIKPLEKAIFLDPSRADAREWLAIALADMGRHDEALRHFRLAAEVEPLWPMPLANLAEALAAAGLDQEGMQLVREFRRRGGPEPQAKRFLSLMTHWRGDISSAIANAEAALAADPTLPDLRLVLAIDYHIIGLPQRAPAGLPKEYTQIMTPFYAGNTRALRAKINSIGPRLWDAPQSHLAFFHLARSREWEMLAGLYDARRMSPSSMCATHRAQIVALVLALRETGHQATAQAVLQCLRKQVAVESRMKVRSPGRLAGALEFDRATLAGLDGQPADALRWLEAAVAVGWLGRPHSARLADYPQFDRLRSDPRYAALQRRIDSKIAKERGEVLALK